MKKFSNISGVKVNEEPKKEVKIEESDIFKSKVLDLMDNLLSVRTYGPVDRYQRAGNIKIAGKELLAEALIDLLKQESSKDKAKLLESLKSEIKDWSVLDNKIDSIISESYPKLSNVRKIKSLLSKYDNSELLIKVIESNTPKINSIEKLEDYKLVIKESKLDDETKSSIISIYNDRIDLIK